MCKYTKGIPMMSRSCILDNFENNTFGKKNLYFLILLGEEIPKCFHLFYRLKTAFSVLGLKMSK